MQNLCVQALSTVGTLGLEHYRRAERGQEQQALTSHSSGSGSVQEVQHLRSLIVGTLVAEVRRGSGHDRVLLKLLDRLQQQQDDDACHEEETMDVDDVGGDDALEEDVPAARRLAWHKRQEERLLRVAFVRHNLWYVSALSQCGWVHGEHFLPFLLR